MVKADLIRHLETRLNISHERAYEHVENILEMIGEDLANGVPVLISGFGQWRLQNKTKRVGRNPLTNEEYEISPRRVVSFQPSSVWIKQINQKTASQ